MKTIKQILYLFGYAFTGQWLMVMFCSGLLAGWKYIDLHAGDKDELLGATFSNDEDYLVKLSKGITEIVK